MSAGTVILLILVITLIIMGGAPIAISIGVTSLGYFLYTRGATALRSFRSESGCAVPRQS